MGKKGEFNFNWDDIEEKQGKLDDVKSSGGANDDPRFYKVKTDSEGRFLATVRFLPPPQGESVARVPYYSHYFSGVDNSWYVEACPKTIGKKCPVCDHTYEIYTEYGKEGARKRNAGKYQKKAWISNILVLEDKQNPENEGKVFLYKYGVTVKDILDDARKPEDPDQDPINPYDFTNGADFRLAVYQKETPEGKFPQYDKCKFKSQSELYDGDYDKLSEMYGNCESLEEFVKEESYEEYEVLKKKLFKTIGKDYEDVNTELDDFTKKEEKSEKETPKQTPKDEPKKEEKKVELNEVEDEDDFFKSLRDDD